MIGSDELSAPSIPDKHPGDNTITSEAEWVHKSKFSNIPLVPEINKELIRYIETGVFGSHFIETNELIKLTVF